MLWELYNFRLTVNTVGFLVGSFPQETRRNHWWTTATNLQSYHFFEHVLLLTQLLAGYKPTGIGGLWFPRIELHFVYNLMVLIPMLLAIKPSKPPSNYRGVS